MESGGARSAKGNWFVIFAAFIWLEILLTTFGSFLATNYARSGRPAPGAESLHSLAYIVTPLAVVAAIYWARAKLASAADRAPTDFIRDSIVALGIAELGMMFGVVAFMRTDWLQIVIFGLLTIFVDFAIVLPAGVRYWSQQEALAKKPDSARVGGFEL